MVTSTTDGSGPYVSHVLLKLTSGMAAFVMNSVSGVVLARTLGVQGNGTLALLILLPTMIAFFGSLGVDKANAYLAGGKKHGPQALLGNSVILTATMTLLLGSVYWMAMPLMLRFLAADHATQPLLASAFLLVPLSLLEMYLYGILWGQGRIPQLCLVSVVRFSSLLVLNVALVWMLGLSIRGGLVAAIATPAICIAVYGCLLRKDVGKWPFGYDRRSLDASLCFGVQAHLGSVLQFLNRRLDVFIVNYFAGARAVGLYVVAVSLAESVWYLPDASGFVLFSKTASSEPQVAKQFTPRVARVTGVITAVAAVGLFLAGRAVIRILYTEQFLPSLEPMWVLLPGVVLLSYSKVIFGDLGGQGKPRYGTYAALLACIVTVGLDLVLIPRWGIMGAAMASSLAYAVNALVAVVSYVTVTRIRVADLLLIRKDDVVAGINAGHRAVLALRQWVSAQRA